MSYDVCSDWFCSFGEITPGGLEWLADALRELGYDATVRLRGGEPDKVVVDRAVSSEHWQALCDEACRLGLVRLIS